MIIISTVGHDDHDSLSFSHLSDENGDWEWDSNNLETLSSDQETNEHGVHFDLANTTYHEAPQQQEAQPLTASDTWFSRAEIDQFKRQAASAAQSPTTQQVKTCLEGAYRAALRTPRESSRSPLKKQERRTLLTQYSMDVVGTERDLISSFQCESELRRYTILKMIQQLSPRAGAHNHGNNNGSKSKACLLREENAIRVAASRISLPARVFATEMGQLQVAVQ